MFFVWFPSWLCITFQLIHNIPRFSLDLCCVTLLRICRQIAQIEHFYTLTTESCSERATEEGEVIRMSTWKRIF